MRASATPRLAALAAIVVGLLFLPLPVNEAQAQTTYTVTVGPKTSAHPRFNQGWDESYRINGLEGAELTLLRGQTYNFQMNNVDSMHPFYISTSAIGGSQGIYTQGVTGNFAWGNGVLTFTVPDSAPDELWYQCGSHSYMGWRLVIAGGTGGEEGATARAFNVTAVAPNPFGTTTTLLLDLPVPAEVKLTLFDLQGRQVGEQAIGSLTAGTRLPISLDGYGLAAGVYVYTVEALTPTERLVASGRLTYMP
jgi:hypothetical protein